MKTLSLFTFLMVCGFNSLSQKSKTVYIDTINLRGIVIGNDDKPVADIALFSRQAYLGKGYSFFTKTNPDGMFEIKGAKPNDTITIRSLSYGKDYYNQGSRFMVIRLPLKHYVSNGAVEITAERKYPRFLPKFKIEPPDNTEIYSSTESLPLFIGGTKSFYRYIQQRLLYPEKARKLNIEGTVEIAFDISKDGSVTNIRLLKGIGYGCDEEAIKTLESSPKWFPAHMDGKAVIVTETIAIQFKLTDKQ